MRVDELDVAHLGAVAQVCAVRGLAHALLAAGDDDLRRPRLDLLRAERDGARPEPQSWFIAQAGDSTGNAGGDRGLARRVLSRAGRQDLAEDHLRDVPRLDPGTLEGGLDGHLAELVRRQARRARR